MDRRTLQSSLPAPALRKSHADCFVILEPICRMPRRHSLIETPFEAKW